MVETLTITQTIPKVSIKHFVTKQNDRTILQKMKTDNNRFRILIKKNLSDSIQFIYQIPHTQPIPVSPFCLDN